MLLMLVGFAVQIKYFKQLTTAVSLNEVFQYRQKTIARTKG